MCLSCPYHVLMATNLIGSPADQNDLRRGDVILSVNGESTQSLLHSEVVSLMKAAGSNGSIVLGIQRKGTH